MRLHPPLPGRCRGISLVELMIGLTLSLFILGALAQAFAFSSEARRGQEATARLMDGGRSASEILGRALRLSTYWGCPGVDNKSLTIHTDASPPGGATDDYKEGYATRGLFGIDAVVDGVERDELITWQALDNVVTELRRATTMSDPADGSSDLNSRNALTVTSATGFAAGDWVALNDCRVGEVFNIDSASGTSVTYASSCPTCFRQFREGSMLRRVQRNRFFIATGSRGAPSLSLYLERDEGTRQELVEGVEAMSLSYGLDDNLNGVIESYITGTDVTNLCKATATSVPPDPTCWSRVASVRVALLMSTVEDGVTKQAQTYTFNGSIPLTATDRRLRREVVAVVAVRNTRNF